MAKKGSRKQKVEPASRGLTPRQVAATPPAKVAALGARVEEDGGSVLASYRDPLGGAWQLLVALPLDKVQPTPYQRDLSAAHVKRLSGVLAKLDRFLDPIIAVQSDAGGYWTPNGHHRLAALRELGGRSIVALLVPETELAYQILALNTEKAHNLRERSLEVIRMARDLAELDAAPEKQYADAFEEPALLTLGACYEKKPRFAGSVYHSVLKRVETFLGVPLAKALLVRDEHAERVLELDGAVADAVAKLKEKGFDSPYLKNFVVARINPLRFQRGAKQADFDATFAKMLASARGFQAGKVKLDQLARAGGPLDE